MNNQYNKLYLPNGKLIECQNRNIQGREEIYETNMLRSNGRNTLNPGEKLKIGNIIAQYEINGMFRIYRLEGTQYRLIWHMGIEQNNAGFLKRI